MDSFGDLWQADWKELAERLGAGQVDSDNWGQVDGVVRGKLALISIRAAEAAEATARATRRLAWATFALAIASVALLIVDIYQG